MNTTDIDSLMEKFDSIQELPVSEELIGAFMENTLIGSDLREVSNFMDNNPDFAAAFDIEKPYSVGRLGSMPVESELADTVVPDIMDAWQIPNPEVFFSIYDDCYYKNDMMVAASAEIFPDNPLDCHIDNANDFDNDPLDNFSLPSDL